MNDQEFVTKGREVAKDMRGRGMAWAAEVLESAFSRAEERLPEPFVPELGQLVVYERPGGQCVGLVISVCTPPPATMWVWVFKFNIGEKEYMETRDLRPIK